MTSLAAICSLSLIRQKNISQPFLAWEKNFQTMGIQKFIEELAQTLEESFYLDFFTFKEHIVNMVNKHQNYFLRELFSSDKCTMNLIVQTFLRKRSSEKSNKCIAWVILCLCESLQQSTDRSIFFHQRSVTGATLTEESLEALMSKDQSKRQQCQLKIMLFLINNYYTINYQKRTFELRGPEEIREIINSQEKDMKAYYYLIKGVKKPDEKKLRLYKDRIFSSTGLFFLFNALTSAQVFGNNIASYISPHSSAGHTATEIVYGELIFNFAAFIMSSFRNGTIKKRRSLKLTSQLTLNCLNKSIELYQYKFPNIPLSKDFFTRLQKYRDKSKVFLFLRKGYRKIKILFTFKETYITSENVVYNRHIYFDNIHFFKNCIYELNNAKNNNISKIILSKLENHINQLDENEFQQTVHGIVFKVSKVRGTLVQHLLNIYNKNPNLIEIRDLFFRKMIQKKAKRTDTLPNPPRENFNTLFDKIETIVSDTNWQDRDDACFNSHIILQCIFESSISGKEKNYLLQMILENLKDRNNGPMALLLQRRQKAHVENLIISSISQTFIFPRHALLACMAKENLATLGSDLSGWGASSLINPLFKISSTTDTTTFKSILTSFEAAAKLTKQLALQETREGEEELSVNPIHLLLNKKSFISKKDADFIIKYLRKIKEKGSRYLSFVLEYRHGKEIPLLFELMDKFPPGNIKALLKVYFAEEDLSSSTLLTQHSNNEYDNFNLFLSQGIRKTKSIKQAALLILKGMAYLLILQDKIKQCDNPLLEEQQRKIYEACKIKLETTVHNAYKDRYSEFCILTRSSPTHRFLSELGVRLVGNISWGVFSSAIVVTALNATASVGLAASLTGIGLPLGICLLVITAIIRVILDSYGDYFSRYKRKTKIYQSLQKNIDNIIQLERCATTFQQGFNKENLEKFNLSLRSDLKRNLKNKNDEFFKNRIYSQMVNFFGYDVDSEKIEKINAKETEEEKIREFERIKKDIMFAQCFDKTSLLEALYRMNYIILTCHLSPSKKLEILVSFFDDFTNENSLIFKLKLENSFVRTKRWFVPQFFLGIISSASKVISIYFPSPKLLFGVSMAGDIITAQGNRPVFNSPTGNTKSFQLASSVLKNSLLILYRCHKEIFNKNEHAKIKRLLNLKTSRLGKFYPILADSAKIYSV